MTQKEAIIEALKRLGGKANLNDIYRFAYTLADFSGSKDWKATIRWYLQKETDAFRSSKRGWWELVSFQEEIASRDRRIKELEALLTTKDNEIAELKKLPTEECFVRRLVNATKNLFGVNRKHADYVRQVLLKLGRDEDQEELLAWIERREQQSVKKATKKIIQKITNSQIFNGAITESEFNGGGMNNEE
jgi:hypothetical protein